VTKFFAEGVNRDVCGRLAAAGVRIAATPDTRRGGPLAGRTFVLTGALRALTREEAADRIRGRGGRVTDRVSPRTDYVVVGTAAGAKLARARGLGLPTLDEGAFLEMVR
jgi:DNA ligase (NAD+)